MTVSAARTRTPFAGRRLVAHACSLAGGVAFTLGIAWTLQQPVEEKEEKPDLTYEDIRTVDLPDPPPPPPAAEVGVPLPPMPVVFDEAPSTSSVRVPPTPIPVALIVPPTPPAAQIQFGFSPGEFRPGATSWDADEQHVFQKSEVDQAVVVIYRKRPDVSATMIKDVAKAVVTLLFVVNVDGSVENVRVVHGVNAEFDQLVADAIREWRFRPAIRKGRKVRQMAQMNVIVRAPSTNPFTID